MEITLWAIMDKKKKAIACGSPRNRSMRLLSTLIDEPSRIILYGTEGRAKAGFSNGNGFYDETWDDGNGDDKYTNTYLKKTYVKGDDNWIRSYEKICIPVRVRMVIDE
jgi:hypothetical protein